LIEINQTWKSVRSGNYDPTIVSELIEVLAKHKVSHDLAAALLARSIYHIFKQEDEADITKLLEIK
jgi:hypothetical protein